MNTTNQEKPVLPLHLLDFFFTVSAVLLLNTVLAPVGHEGRAVAGLVTTLTLTVLWIFWRRTGATWLVPLFTAAAFASFLIADAVLAFPIQWVALIMLALTSSRALAYSYGGVLIAVTAAIHLASGSNIGRTVSESLAVLLLVAAGLSFATALNQAKVLDERRRQALRELTAANERLQRNLSDSRSLALSEERARIAAALHDGLGHRLTTIGLSLDFAHRTVDSSPELAKEEILQARGATSDALAEMRATVRAMTPVELEDGGIQSALASLAESFAGTGLTVEFRSGNPAGNTNLRDVREQSLNEHTELFLLRATQEALTNTIRHSNADLVTIDLSPSRLAIADNGPGSDEPSLHDGYGLRSLRHRAAEIGATVNIDPHGGLDNGLLLSIDFPEAS